MSKMTSVYIGLLKEDGCEPSSRAGYMRIQTPGRVSEAQLSQIAEIVARTTVVFNDVVAPGYGEITTIAAFTAPHGGVPVWTQHLSAPLDIHTGVIPFVYKGQLMRGVAVQAQVNMQSADLCNL